MSTFPLHKADRPCYLHGHEYRLYSDGSKDCLHCGLYHGPDVAMVNELLRRASGRKAYAQSALALMRHPALPPLPMPVFPKRDTLFGSMNPSWMVLLPIAAFLASCLAFLLGAALAAAYQLLTRGSL